METLYDNLLEYYDEIFPVEQDKLDFLEKLVKKVPERTPPAMAKVLDIGCATGSFALALMRRGLDVTGIDSNSSMIQSACRRNPEPRTNARFFRMDMREVGKTLAKGAYDTVVCLGNTLAHLEDGEDILSFFKQANGLLCSGGYLVVQVVNYDRVLAEKMSRLPPIETRRSRFEREYRPRDDGRLSFETTLFSSTGQIVFRDRVALYPVREMEIQHLATKAGFKKVDFYDDFSSGDYTGTDLGVVAVLQA